MNFINLKNIIDYKILSHKIEDIEDNINHNIIFDGSKLFIRKIEIGNLVICEVSFNWNYLIEKSEKEVLLYTGCKEWVSLEYDGIYKLEIEGKIIEVWLGEVININDYINLDLKLTNNLKTIRNVYARCEPSMHLFDNVHRNYINKHKFSNNEIVAIKSVAGSGKTTTLLNLSKIHKGKKILYLAFNRCLIDEIENKIDNMNIKNLYPRTFDSLTRELFIKNNNFDPNIVFLKPQNIADYIDYFRDKYYNVKKCYVNGISKFCNQVEYDNPKVFSNKVLKKTNGLIEDIWEKMVNNELITFDSMRKLVEMNHWAKEIIDQKYDMIFIDEAQDFDNVMLKILLEDTTIPKLFVGDSLQAIYEWKGSINAFDKLPQKALILEFYSTFRIGNPACKEISDRFDNCWMISKNKKETLIRSKVIPENNYVYLFRTWKKLLQTAQQLDNIWIYDYDKQKELIKRLHIKMSKCKKISKDELSEFSDDLPYFLQKLSEEELTDLLDDIENNLVEHEDAYVIMHTIHSYKGLENDTIRIADDIDIKKEENIYYVALTRGMKEIILDKLEVKTTNIKTMENQQNIDDIYFEELFSELNKELLKELENYRSSKAKELKKPQYCIFHNSCLRSISIKIPKSREELLMIKGIADGKFNKFGKDILLITNKY